MKTKYSLLSLLLLFVLSLNAQDSKINWMDWNSMVAAQKVQPKKVIIDIYTSWCSFCKKMDRNTFNHPDIIAKINKDYYAVKFDAEQKQTIKYDDHTFKFMGKGRKGVHQLAYSLLDGKMSYPSFVYLDEQLERIMISPGYKASSSLSKELQFIEGDHYENISFSSFKNKSK